MLCKNGPDAHARTCWTVAVWIQLTADPFGAAPPVLAVTSLAAPYERMSESLDGRIGLRAV